MTKTLLLAKILKMALLCLLVAAVAGFLSFLNAYGAFLASVTALISFSVYKNHRFGYFAAAGWGLACFQLAKEGYEFQDIKRHAMIAGFIVIPVALFLHEILARPKAKSAQKSVTDEADSRNMPH